MALLDHPEASNESERSTDASPQMGYCSYKNHKGDRNLPAERFGKYKSGNPKSICRMCDSERQSIRREAILADPVTALAYKTAQNEYAKKWHKRPGNKEKQRKYRHDWFERNKDLEVVKKSRAEYRERYPERGPEACKRYRKKMMQNPVKHAEFLEARRLQYRLSREAKGFVVSRTGATKYPVKSKEKMVATGPFATWLRVALKEKGLTAAEVAKLCGVDPTGLAKIVAVNKSNKKWMYISLADKVLTKLDGPPLRSLYPDA